MSLETISEDSKAIALCSHFARGWEWGRGELCGTKWIMVAERKEAC